VRGAGLTAQVVAVCAIELLVARKFELGAASLGVESREGASAQLPFAAIDLLLRGLRQTQKTHSETVTERKVAIDRMILSGGLVRPASQSQMLGPMLRVEQHLEFLVGLVAASVRARGG